jgi:serine/threonine protein kinase
MGLVALETATSVGMVRPASSFGSGPRGRSSRMAINDASGTALSGSPSGGGRPLHRRRCLPAEPGQRVGRYCLIERLGQGSQGEVWKAFRDGIEGDHLALKLLPPVFARDPRRLAQFRHEAERGARISGPAVVTTYDFGEADGVLFMAMRLVDGCSLGEVLSRRRTPGPVRSHLRLHRLAFVAERLYIENVARIMARVARGLARVHAAGVVHRDIKPANILLDRRSLDGGFLCDFGLGRDLDVATPAQMRDGAGTPLYMAPERLLRYRADERLCDIYALGATLFEAVTLAPPFQVPDGLPWHSWYTYLAEACPAPPSEVRASVPAALDAIILKAIDRHPDLRYPSADALAADLETWLADEAGELQLQVG